MSHQLDKRAFRKIKTIEDGDRFLIFLENVNQENAGNVTISYEELLDILSDDLDVIQSITAGTNVTINNTDPNNPIISVTIPAQLWSQGVGVSSRYLTGLSTSPTGQNAIDLGTSNRLTGDYSSAMGTDNDCTAQTTYCIGAEGVAFRTGQIVLANDSHTAAPGHYSQTSILHPLGATDSATPILLRLYYFDTISIPVNSIAHFEGSITAIQNSGGAGTIGDAAVFVFKGTIKNIGGTTALMGSILYQDSTGSWGTTPVAFASEAATSTWTVLVSANNTTDTLDIQVTGQANKNIWWTCSLKLNETNIV